MATRIFKSYTFLRQRCVSAFLLSILLLSRHSNRPITMVHPTTMVTIVMPKTIHRQTCPVCFLCSFLLLIFYNSTTFWYDLICLNWQSYGWNVTIKNFHSFYNNFYVINDIWRVCNMFSALFIFVRFFCVTFALIFKLFFIITETFIYFCKFKAACSANK